MNKKLIGILATTSLAIAGVAFAQSSDVSNSSSSSSKTTKSSKSSKSDLGIGGSPMGTSSQMKNEITGQVVEKKGSSVYVQDHMGAVVELKTDKSTKFEGIKRDQLKQGDQIRASFDVRHKTENLAKSISLESQPAGTGGTGSNLGSKKEGSPSEEKGETPAQEQQEQKGMGSSGQSNQPDQPNY